VFETVVAVLLLIPKTARLGAGLAVVWMTAVILSHIFVLGYGWFFVDALIVMMLAVIYILLTRRRARWGEPKVWGRRLPYKRTKNSRREQLEAEPQSPVIGPQRWVTLSMAGIFPSARPPTRSPHER
jgi:chromate transport protein ChrA